MWECLGVYTPRGRLPIGEITFPNGDSVWGVHTPLWGFPAEFNGPQTPECCRNLKANAANEVLMLFSEIALRSLTPNAV